MTSRFLLTLAVYIAAATSFCINAQSSTFNPKEGELFIIPTDADGNIGSPDSDNNYEGMRVMTDNGNNHLTISGVTLPHASFAIYAKSSTTNYSTFYSPAAIYVQPIPLNVPSPLTICPKQTIALMEPGTYDFDFYSRDIDGIATHMIIVTSAEGTDVPQYPASLFMVSGTSSSDVVEIPGSATTGYYHAEVPVVDNFRLSYEKTYNIDAFIYGPTEGSGVVTLNSNEREPISYATNTSATFVIDQAARNLTTNSVYMYVRLNSPGKSTQGYIRVSPEALSGVEDIAADDNAPAVYYTISGTPLPGTPDRAGLYIMRKGGVSQKVILR